MALAVFFFAVFAALRETLSGIFRSFTQSREARKGRLSEEISRFVTETSVYGGVNV